jgi:hypothetical protein
MITTTKIWLYLAKRDKKGIELLSIFDGSKQTPLRVTDITVLNLPQTLKVKLENIIYDKRFFWEPWLESAETYKELKNNLKLRGYSSIPVNGQPAVGTNNLNDLEEVNTKAITNDKIMLQKRKD